jgi:Yip1 domain
MQIMISRVKGLLVSPVSTFQEILHSTDHSVFVYCALLVFFKTCMNEVISELFGLYELRMFRWMDWDYSLLHGAPGGTAIQILIFFLAILYWFIFLIIAGAWVHCWVWLLGGRNGLMQTMKAFLYGMTPWLVFGWIPLIGILFSIWSVILAHRGIRELTGLRMNKGMYVVLAIIISAVFIVLFSVLPASTFFVND